MMRRSTISANPQGQKGLAVSTWASTELSGLAKQEPPPNPCCPSSIVFRGITASDQRDILYAVPPTSRNKQGLALSKNTTECRGRDRLQRMQRSRGIGCDVEFALSFPRRGATLQVQVDGGCVTQGNMCVRAPHSVRDGWR